MKSSKIIISKTVKLPIEGINYSNRVVSVTIEYESEGFSMNMATDEINQYLTMLKDDDPDWIKKDRQLTFKQGGEIK